MTFRSHLDGSEQRLTPERAMEIQARLGSDIAMALDECPPSDAPRAVDRGGDGAHDRAGRGAAWRRRRAPGQLRFGIVQGGDRTSTCAARHLDEIAALPFDGLALGGLGVGEPPEVMYGVSTRSRAEMPADRPRYLMGVGTPDDIWTAIGAGIDMFDCVMPTRNARNGQLFVRAGQLNIANARTATTRARSRKAARASAAPRTAARYLSHLFHAKELLYYRLATFHNLQHYLDLARRAREAIVAGSFPARPAVVNERAWRSGWGSSSRAAGVATAATSPRRCWRSWCSIALAPR